MTFLLVSACAAMLAGPAWVVVAQRRRVRLDLIARGTRVPATVVYFRRRAERPGIILATYRDGRGQHRTVAKIPARTRDRYAFVGPAFVLFDVRYPARDDRVLLGFGESPRRWHRVVFDERSAHRARTHAR